MRTITVHHTKINGIGTFQRRIMGLIHGDSVLLVTPCVKPSCPDLGFTIVPVKDLNNESFKEIKDFDDLDPRCLAELETKFQSEPLEEADSTFSQRWFQEVARVTELEKYLLKPFSRLID